MQQLFVREVTIPGFVELIVVPAVWQCGIAD